MNNAKTTVIYHSADFDGIFCREIARKFLPDAEFIGWNFGDATIPFPMEGRVYILDLPPECVTLPPYSPESEKDCWSRLIWIDHHKSSIEKWPTNLNGYRIDGVAACRLAWQWFNADARLRATSVFPEKHDEWMAKYPLPVKSSYVDRQVAEPLAVRLAGEYDIWDKRDPDAELFQYAFRSRDLTPDIWQMLLMDSKNEGDKSDLGTHLVYALLDAGQCLQYAKTQENESIIKSAGFDLDFEGLHFIACNHARYNSFLFMAALKPEHDACLGFAWRAGKWTVSLYHAPGKEHHDLSVIAQKHGGGGHKGACGFICKTLPFELK